MDPHFRPDAPLRPADIVNLGYVLNVIEDPAERSETLRKAFALAMKALVVAVRVDQSLDKGLPFQDGLITSRGSFQKIYSQAEFRQFVGDTLGVRPYIAGLGVAYAFKEGTPEPNAELAAIEGRLAAIEKKIEPAGLDSRLEELEQLIRGLKPSPLYMTLSPSLIAFLGALAGVWIGGWNAERLQRARLAQDEKVADKKSAQDLALSEKQAKLQIGNAVIEWEIKQLSLLYGPLRALLGQSVALYRETNTVLIERSKRFRMINVGEEKPEFQIETTPGVWTRFRTVLHIFEVYGKDYGVEAYFDEIVSIGAEMVKIIQQQAGYARAEEKDLMAVFGRYLAHFAVLKSMHEAAKAKVMPSKPDADAGALTRPAPTVNLSAAFPDTIHGLINQGFDAITADILQWRKRAAA